MSARHGRAVYDVLAAIARGEAPPADAPAPARQASEETWARVVAVEGCGAQLHGLECTRAAGEDACDAVLPPTGAAILRVHAEQALRQSLRLIPQLAAILPVAEREGVRLMALKGSARLLSGAYHELRTTNDIDLLVVEGDAERLHAALRRECGYHVREVDQVHHHLPPLRMAGSMEVELHTRVSRVQTALAAAMVQGAREMRVAGHALLIPSPTPLFLHALEHAVIGNWSTRYRLRDLLDLAASWLPEVDAEAVRDYVARSIDREALEVALSAAHAIEPRLPAMVDDAWDVVRRVGRARAGANAAAREWSQSNRLRMVAGVLAEGSPRSMARLAGLALRRPRRIVRTALAALAIGCGGDAGPTGPTPPPPPQFPVVGAFVFVSNETGANRLYRWSGGTVTVLGGSVHGDTDPHSAAGKLVFTSYRDGNAEVYVANADGTTPQRRTTNAGFDGEARLSPNGSKVAFVSTRAGGIHRLWVMNANGSGLDSLNTSRPFNSPERAPAWSPDGQKIAFTSTRSSTSQVWVVNATGGAAVQVTSEAGGAFNPVWSQDGQYILYVEAASTPRIRRAHLASGARETVAFAPGGLGPASCNGQVCLSARGEWNAMRAIIAYLPGGGKDSVMVSGSATLSHPAFVGH